MPNVMPESLAEQIIAAKIKEWEQKRKELKNVKSTEIHPFLTISRDFGCGEEEIIPKLEQTLKWNVYGRNLLDRLAQRETLSRGFIETLDEQRQTVVDDWVNFLIHSGAVLQKDYVLKISKLIQVIAHQESAIFLGRGANFILKDKRIGLRIKLTATFAYRVQNIMKLRTLSEKEAEDLVRQKDKERIGFVREYFAKEAIGGCEVDMIINTSTLNGDLICKIIEFALEEKKSKR